MIRSWTVSFRKIATLALLSPMLALLGCSDSTTAKVVGKVSFQGKPASGGILVFGPIAEAGETNPGRPVTVEVQPDGTYTTTRGAVVGRCSVSYIPPEVPLPPGKVLKPSEPAPQSPYTGMAPMPNEVEVKEGENTVDFELRRR